MGDLEPGKAIVQQLEQIWTEAHAWPGFVQAMHALLGAYSSPDRSGNKILAKWASLPGLCCQAAGGQAEWAHELAVAWMVFYGAARIMDTVEDGDPPDPEWSGLSQGMIVNAACGLYFSASAVLENMKKRQPQNEAADRIIAEFYRGFLAMCGGQHQDLDTARPDMEPYWEIATRKSGVFFALACHLGALLATKDEQRLAGFHCYGVQLGLMMQLMDDIDDVKKVHRCEDREKLYKTLPVIYALSRGKPKTGERLRELLQAGSLDHNRGEEIINLVDESGAVQYLIQEFSGSREKAVAGLRQARPAPGYEEKLIAFLPHLY